MADRSVSRRAFLGVSGGLLLASALPEVAAAHEEPKLGKNVSALVLSSDLYASPDPQRFVFGLGSSRGYVSGPPVHVGFAPPDTSGDLELALERARLYKGGLPKGRGVYVTEPVLDKVGIWAGVAIVKKREVEFAIQVNEAPFAPLVGAPASRAESPTVDNALDVDPICTRDPQCDLHDVSLTEVIGAGSPVAVLFATPARCQSEYCGPVLDTLLSIRDRYPDTTFVHVEIYQNNETTNLVPTLDAWGLESEPWLFTIDSAGAIAGRLDGAFGKQEMIDLLDALT